MAVVKCKMCGGNLNLIESESVAECEYCGSRQTVPSADNEKKLTLFARANRLRLACEFDKAAGVYESIVAEFPEEAEAYWGLVLCKYGIEYVDDPATGKKIPACHRSAFESVLEDSDFEQAQENADVVARRIYREEAKAVEEIRKGIIEVSGREEPYDIFICYKETDENGDRTLDSVLAQELYDALTEKGYRVFFSRITLEDKLGQEYEPYIFAALNSARVMLAVGTDYEYYNAVWVKNEWSRFLKLMETDQEKVLVPCYKNLDAYDMPKEFTRLQVQDLGKAGAVQDLLRSIEKILSNGGQKVEEQAAVAAQLDVLGASSLLRRGQLFLEDGEWESAHEYFDKVLDIDPENTEAYLGQLLAKRRVHNRDELANQENPFDNEPLYQKALHFSDAVLRETLMQLAKKNKRIAEENRRIAEESKRIMEEKRRCDQERLLLYRNRIAPVAKSIAAGNCHSAGLWLSGRVVADGDDTCGQRFTVFWTDIVAIAAGGWHTVGLRSDGRVEAVGYRKDGRCEVSGWINIVAIAAGGDHTVGLKNDGRVVAVGENEYAQCEVFGWTDIVAIAAGSDHTVGLKSDGRVEAIGYKKDGRCKVSGWTDIVAIAAGGDHTVGLRSDGRVEAVGYRKDGRCEVSGWTDIVAIAAGGDHTVGLKSDGRVVAAGSNNVGQCEVSGWTDIVAIAAGRAHTVGLKSDGRIVTVGANANGQCDISRWRLFQSLNTLEQERDEIRERQQKEEIERQEAKREAAERTRKKAELEQKKKALETALANLNGLFTGKRRKELKTMIAEIEHEWKMLD